MRLIVAGSRSFHDTAIFKQVIEAYFKEMNVDTSELVILEGEARGTDKLAKGYAYNNGIKFEGFPADWSQGARAGHARNRRMAEKATHLLAFWDWKSPGTKDMIRQAYVHNLEVNIYSTQGDN